MSSINQNQINGARPKKIIFKVAITALLLAILYKMTDKEGLIATIKEIRPTILLDLVLMYSSGQIVSVYKWSRLLKATGVDYKFSLLCRAYFFGMFVNSAALGTIGGDVARGVFLKPEAGSRTKVASSIIVDRIHGLMTLILVSVVGFSFAGRFEVAATLLLSFIFALSIWYLAPRKMRRILHRYLIVEKVATAFDTALPKNKTLLIQVTLISATLHIIQAMMYPLIFSELDTVIPLASVFAFIPLINIASSLPISIQGLGVREGMLALFFTRNGLTLEHAIAAGLLWFITVSIVSLLAGLWILLTERKVSGAKNSLSLQ